MSPWGLDLESERSSSRPQPNLSLAFKKKAEKPATNLRIDWVEGYFFPSLDSFPTGVYVNNFTALHRLEFEEKETRS